MSMTRTIISLDDADKQWIEQLARTRGVSMTEIVREAIRRMRREEEESVDVLLEQTKRTWREGDGLQYQRRVRGEWQ